MDNNQFYPTFEDLEPAVEFEIKAYRVVSLPADMQQCFGCTHGVVVEDELDVLLDQAQAANASEVLRAVEGQS